MPRVRRPGNREILATFPEAARPAVRPRAQAPAAHIWAAYSGKYFHWPVPQSPQLYNGGDRECLLHGAFVNLTRSDSTHNRAAGIQQAPNQCRLLYLFLPPTPIPGTEVSSGPGLFRLQGCCPKRGWSLEEGVQSKGIQLSPSRLPRMPRKEGKTKRCREKKLCLGADSLGLNLDLSP